MGFALALSVLPHHLVPGALLVVGVSFFLRSHLFANAGRAELHADRVVLIKEREELVVTWHELAGFRDGHLWHVELVLRGDGDSSWKWGHCIPTPTDEARTRVLDHLTRAGVARLET